mmetsp:Transcript_31727/g.57444  ORF Transcript_31727/g.57444 Transcript_31727/m.57444 type:complete len:530 (-) Transcript_31727:111-1700(-)|eukprot:CAMPEP_0201933594 /NCGR_PEP_ID=MMETSP0903-20130614/31891_1 /ASSEMBLY_ACC=CAM_ASM_000552 /TAXON_ID=420261 /ORGANISM="Thalassiosira antarctica, Strain CCMP982" /LENGTH=529 /DNA_ID=CAMNT_0048473575 /DNA_START=60 /DNA_END=1649 /DNA_ORIENTATION=-
MTSENNQWRQSSHHHCCSIISIGVILFRLASTTSNVASAFSFHSANDVKLGKQTGRIGSSIHPLEEAGKNRHRHNTILFSQPDRYTIADDESLSLSHEEIDVVDHDAPIKIINGTADKFIVTELYNIPPEGFPEANGKDGILSLSTLFTPDDITRLRLEPRNVTLSAALMLLDPEKYPTQSRARKVIRQKSICICRSDASTLKFDELGKVITRIYTGDVIGFQRRAGSDYYAIEGVPFRPPPFEVPIVYEDDRMAIVNKPAGVVMYQGGRGSSGGGHGRDTLLSALPFILKHSKFADVEVNDDGTQNVRRPQFIHRLDRPTSGLVVVAKTKAATTHLSQQFELRKARKTYMAIVNGYPKQSTTSQENTVSSLDWNTIDYDLDGKSAITEWRVIKTVKSLHGRDGQLTLVELKPKTGRYHQLRRHMAWVCNSPLVGDTTYDEADDSALRLRKRGLFLCSNEIELEHPYYNTESGRKEWIDMGCREMVHGDTLLCEDEDTGTVMIKATTELPQKFESFMHHENARAIKFAE